jgi:hypothetical protein
VLKWIDGLGQSQSGLVSLATDVITTTDFSPDSVYLSMPAQADNVDGHCDNVALRRNPPVGRKVSLLQ